MRGLLWPGVAFGMTTSPDAPLIRRAEILAIGTELLLGETVDTNGARIAARLAEHGVDVYWSMRVGDNLMRIVEALEVGLARSDLIVTSGGLGPTDDDLTREAIAELVGETPHVDAELEGALRAFFERLGRTMPERNVKQAWTIPSCTPLDNPNGTAPGWFVRFSYQESPRIIAALPGPPRELHPMLEEQLLPRLALPDAHLWTRTWKTGGIGESHVADLLGDVTLQSNPSVATYAREDGVHVRIAAKAEDAAQAEALGRPMAERVHGLLRRYVWGKDDDDLASLVIASLQRDGARLAIAERASAGRLAMTLAAADPEREVLAGSVVGWHVDARDVLASSSDARLESLTDVADEVKTFFAADAAIAVGELRPVDGEGGGVQVDVAVRDASGASVETLTLPGRSGPWLRDRVVLLALDLLRRRLRDSR